MSLSTKFPSQASLTYYSLTISILLGGLLSLHTNVSAQVVSGSLSNIPSLDEFSWDKLTPEKELVWQECFPGRQCARLIVPLNYSEPEGDEAIIAVIRKPSIVSVTSSDYLGPVLFNPGHSSGVDMIQGPRGDLFSVLLGPQFDVVSFDPRGIGHSTPSVFILSTPTERAIWESSQVQNTDDSDATAHPWAAQFRLKIAEQRHLNHLIKIQANQTAQDMLRIVEAHGRTKIQYWGLSYWSDLSAAFPSMFPDRIDRFVIYAIVDSTTRTNTFMGMMDTNKTMMQSLYNWSTDACPDKCRSWASSPDEILQNLTNLMDEARPAPGESDNAGSSSRCSQDSSNLLTKKIDKASSANLCNDDDDIPDENLQHDYFGLMPETDSEFDNIWAEILTNCTDCPKCPKQDLFVANTSHPMLLISNEADWVTSWAAKQMSREFPNSVVLTENLAGHGFVSTPLCTLNYVRQYFIDGKLPEPGTVCEVGAGPFDSEEGLEEE